MQEPAFILGRALAAWANHPDTSTAASRESAAVCYQRFIEDVCRNWDLVIASMPSLEETKRED